jgi:hypothetical protein
VVALLNEGGLAAGPLDDAGLRDVLAEAERRHGGQLGDDVAMLALSGRAQPDGGPGSSTRSNQ